MGNNGRCDWCLQQVAEGESTTVIDKLLLHNANNNLVRTRTCEQMYRDYCRFIRESGEREVQLSLFPNT